MTIRSMPYMIVGVLTCIRQSVGEGAMIYKHMGAGPMQM